MTSTATGYKMRAKLRSQTGRSFLDTNENGSVDAGEKTVQTDQNGEYTFSDLSAGSYTVSQELPFGWSNVYPGQDIGDLTPQIVGGEDASLENFPYIAALLSTSGSLIGEEGFIAGQFCGGSLIASKWILSAAHCFVDGAQQGTFTLSNGVEVEFTSFIPPPLGETTPEIVAPGTGCSADDFTSDPSGKVVILEAQLTEACDPNLQYENAADAGAAGVIFYEVPLEAASAGEGFVAHPKQEQAQPFLILISEEDAQTILTALTDGTLTATFGEELEAVVSGPQDGCGALRSEQPQRHLA